MRASFKERHRNFMVEQLNNIEGVSCFSPGGAFYVFPDISAYLNSLSPFGQPIESSTDLCLYLLDEAGLALVPGGLLVSQMDSDELRRSYGGLSGGYEPFKHGLARLS